MEEKEVITSQEPFPVKISMVSTFRLKYNSKQQIVVIRLRNLCVSVKILKSKLKATTGMPIF